MRKLMVGILVMVLSGCAGAGVERYEVRAVVLEVQNEAGSPAGLMLLHERIDGFKNREGQKDSMAPMAMFFQAGPGMDLQNLKPKDKVRITFEMHWQPETRLLITRLEALPQETQLNLEGLQADV